MAGFRHNITTFYEYCNVLANMNCRVTLFPEDGHKNNGRNTNKLRLYFSKGKAVPLQAWSGPEGSRKLRFPDFMTTAQDGGKVVSLTHRLPLPAANTPGTHFC